jgi:hypothetical protein
MEHELSELALGLKPGVYQHYKGNFYQVLGVCRHSETLEEMVVYQAFYGSYGWWVRPLKMFLENVEKDGQTFSRFKYIGQNR